MTTARVSTCIVGGGPAGLMLGLLLAKRGADVLVLEGHEDFDREFRGEVLQPSTAHLLDKLGLLEYVKAQPHSLLEAGRVRLNGKEVGEFSFKRIVPQYPYAIWMPQPIFLAALLRKAETLPSFQCWMGAKVTELLQEDGRVVGVSGRRHGKEPFAVRADVVVGADGRHSAVAKLGGFRAEYEHHDFDVIWFTIEQPPGWSSTFYVSLGENVRGLMLPKYPHHIQAGIVLPTGEWRRWRQDGPAAVAERVRGLDPIFTGFAETLRDFTPFFPLEGIIRLVDDWARDGLLLIGDAAHTMSPAGAIGVNVAIATAAVAAQELYPRLGHGPISREDLGAVQRLREDDVRMLHRLQLGAQRVLLGQGSGNPMVRWLVGKVLPLLLQSPLLPRLQRRLFFGAPLPPLDPAFSFRDRAGAAPR
ncbi:MAG TPA: FAD-dependent monooxygenase [Methylomirabilota bacterium]|nr:FAD-dependent monooxygenase [Methylomirabilota bacterium]